MKLRILFLGLLLTGCTDWSADKLVNPATKGTIINGFEVGKCYTRLTDNPFDDDIDIKLIIDSRGDYIRYRWWLGSKFGYGKPFSKKAIYREQFTEIKCP